MCRKGAESFCSAMLPSRRGFIVLKAKRRCREPGQTRLQRTSRRGGSRVVGSSSSGYAQGESRCRATCKERAVIELRARREPSLGYVQGESPLKVVELSSSVAGQKRGIMTSQEPPGGKGAQGEICHANSTSEIKCITIDMD